MWALAFATDEEAKSRALKHARRKYYRAIANLEANFLLEESVKLTQDPVMKKGREIEYFRSILFHNLAQWVLERSIQFLDFC